jgi:phosphatidylglycerophosphate synthase
MRKSAILLTEFSEFGNRFVNTVATRWSAMRQYTAYFVSVSLAAVQRFLSRTLATILTALKLILGLVSALALASRAYPLALALLTCAAFLDILDGHVARRLNRASALGAFLDVASDTIVLFAYFAVMFQAQRLTIVSFPLFMLAVSLGITTHFVNFFAQGGFTGDKNRVKPPASATGTLSTALAYGAGIFGSLEGLFPGMSHRYLRLEPSVVLLFLSIFSALFALLCLLVTVRRPSKYEPGDLLFQVHGSDPLFLLLLERLHLKPIDVALCFETFLTLPLFATAIATGLFFEDGHYKGIFWTYSQLWGYAVILPLVSLCAADLYRSAPVALATLRDTHLVQGADYQGFISDARKFFYDKVYIVMIVTATIVAEIWFRIDMVHHDIHRFFIDRHLNVVECIETVVHMASVYLVICVLVYGAATLVMLVRLLKQTDFAMQLFNEDRCVGLKPVVHLLTVFSNLVVLILGEFALAIIDAVRLRLPVVMHLIIFVFCFIALPLLTFFPIWIVHERLLEARREWTARLNIWFQGAGSGPIGDSTSGAAVVPGDLLSFAKADEVKRAIDRIPMWPLPAYKAVVFAAKLIFTVMAFGASIQEIRH